MVTDWTVLSSCVLIYSSNMLKSIKKLFTFRFWLQIVDICVSRCLILGHRSVTWLWFKNTTRYNCQLSRLRPTDTFFSVFKSRQYDEPTGQRSFDLIWLYVRGALTHSCPNSRLERMSLLESLVSSPCRIGEVILVFNSSDSTLQAWAYFHSDDL